MACEIRVQAMTRSVPACSENPAIAATNPDGAVIANAIFNAVGVRLLELPMTPARIKAALEKVGGR